MYLNKAILAQRSFRTYRFCNNILSVNVIRTSTYKAPPGKYKLIDVYLILSCEYQKAKQYPFPNISRLSRIISCKLLYIGDRPTFNIQLLAHL